VRLEPFNEMVRRRDFPVPETHPCAPTSAAKFRLLYQINSYLLPTYNSLLHFLREKLTYSRDIVRRKKRPTVPFFVRPKAQY